MVALAAESSLETGSRRSELLRIAWSDCDRRRGTVWLTDAKMAGSDTARSRVALRCLAWWTP